LVDSVIVIASTPKRLGGEACMAAQIRPVGARLQCKVIKSFGEQAARRAAI
jgi:hypothetical protein